MKNMKPDKRSESKLIMYVSWQIIEHIFFKIVNHEILVAMVTNTRLIFHGYVMALYVIDIVIVNP